MTSVAPQDPAVARVRIICFDGSGAVLLMKWRDPHDGRTFWEPPGGGIEEGETPREAAERELYEETGYRRTLGELPVTVARDYHFAGRHHQHLEAFFRTDVDGSPDPGALTDEELHTFVEWRFVASSELATLDAPIEPPALEAVLASFECSS